MNATTTTTFPAPRVAPRLAHAFGGVWRLTFRRLLLPGHWLTVTIGLAVLTLLSFGAGHDGRTGRFLDWAANFYVAFLVPALAFISAGGAMRDEMKSSAVDYVLTRPVPRWAFVIFKFIAHTLCAQLDLLLALGVVIGIAGAYQVPELGAVAAKLLFGQVLLVVAFSALGFLCGVLTSRYVVIGLAYAAIVEAGVGQIPTQLSRLSMTQQTRDLLAVLLHRVEAHANSPGIFDTTGIVLALSTVAIAAAAALFATREIGGAGES